MPGKGKTGATNLSSTDPIVNAQFALQQQKERERAKQLSGEVTSRQASEEEIEQMFTKPQRKRRPRKKKQTGYTDWSKNPERYKDGKKRKRQSLKSIRRERESKREHPS